MVEPSERESSAPRLLSGGPQPLDAVLFDLDGTLVDTEGQIAAALIETLADFEHRATREEVRRIAGTPLHTWLVASLGMAPGEAETVYDAYLQRTLDRYAPLATPMPDAERLLQALEDRGIPLAIVTTRMLEVADVLLAAVGWSKRFPVVVAQRTAARPKPAPDPAEYALRALGVAPERAAMVGNTEADMVCGLQAGIQTVIGITGERTAEMLLAAGATHVRDSLIELETLLLGSVS